MATSSGVKITVKDKGFQELVRRLEKMNGALTVGIHPEQGGKPHPNAPEHTVAEVASWHEYGAGVPRRSWLRDWFDSVGEAEMAKVLIGGARDALKNLRAGKSPLALFEGIDKEIVASIRRRIEAHIPPPLSPVTIAKKGHDTPLIETKTLYNSIDARFSPAKKAGGFLRRMFGGRG